MFKFPYGFRPASLSERKKYYSLEFDVERVASWLSFRPDHPFITMDLGSQSGICKEEYRDSLGSYYRMKVEDFSKLRYWVLEYLPEDIYYDRNIYDQPEICYKCERKGDECVSCAHRIGQELVFDIDPEEIDCPFCGSSTTISDLDFCDFCLQESLEHTVETLRFLRDYGFKSVQTVFSGRGFHIHVKDRRAFYFSKIERKEIFEALSTQGLETDKFVVTGEAHLIRLPYSLHGLTSRIVLPLSRKQLDTIDEVIGITTSPSFIQQL